MLHPPVEFRISGVRFRNNPTEQNSEQSWRFDPVATRLLIWERDCEKIISSMIVLVQIQPLPIFCAVPQKVDGNVMILSSLLVSTDTKGEWAAHTDHAKLISWMKNMSTNEWSYTYHILPPGYISWIGKDSPQFLPRQASGTGIYFGPLVYQLLPGICNP